MQVFYAVLPVIWVVVATIVGVILYKTSKIVLESASQSEARKRQLRFVGSAVIATVAFVGMQQATPEYQPLPAGSTILRTIDMHSLQELSREAYISRMELGACLSHHKFSECSAEYSRLANALESLHGKSQQLLGGPEVPRPTVEGM